MNREKAKLLLQSYRPGGQDRDDPQFAEALALAEKDPALKQWFEEQHQLDQAISISLQGVPIPAELQAKLLTQVRDIRAGVVPKSAEAFWWTELWQRVEKILSYPVLNFAKATGSVSESAPSLSLWRSRPLMGIAAGLVVLVGLGLWWNTRPATYTTFCQEITASAWDLSPHVQFKSRELPAIRDWLAANQIQAKVDLPPGLQQAAVRGCSIVDWHGRKIPVLCLIEGACHMHFMVVEDLQLADYPSGNNPELLDFGLIRTASWSNKNKIYVLTGLNARTFVKKFRSAGHWNLAS